ncbi:Retrovirus-related Pol polyprotein from transposon RE1 [Bienertia sinuspersici]
MRVIWEELEALYNTPPLSEIGPKIGAHLEKQKEELKLFQFLSGVNEVYSQQRSHILHMSPLPTVEEAYNVLQQEENQRDVFNHSQEETGAMAMNIRKSELSCTNCGKSGHGFPAGFDKGKKKEGQNKEKFVEKPKLEQKWSKVRDNPRKITANVKANNEEGGSSTTNSTTITAQQLEKLIKMLPSLTKDENEGEDELDFSYSRMVVCNFVDGAKDNWIVDSGATNHMSGDQKMFLELQNMKQQQYISLPNGGRAEIKGARSVKLMNGLTLKNVLYFPTFNHSLISVKRLNDEAGCKVVFLARYCITQDERTNEVRAIGKERQRLYYLQKESVDVVMNQIKDEVKKRSHQNNNKVKEGCALNVEPQLRIPDRVEGVRKLKKSTN